MRTLSPQINLACFLTIASLAASTAFAISPPPDGGYPLNNTAEGEDALFSQTTRFGHDNTAIGFQSLYTNDDGEGNTAIGSNAMHNNTDGNENTAVGWNSLYSNFGGGENTAFGEYSLYSNVDGYNNTAIGTVALFQNQNDNNTAIGSNALPENTDGYGNTATGAFALVNNTTGSFNTATGSGALWANVTGIANTAMGFEALGGAGSYNTASGSEALSGNASGNNNTAAGYSALASNSTGSFNTAEGQEALSQNTTGSNNIGLGSGSGQNLTTGDNNIDIGNTGVERESATIRIGTAGTQTKAFVAGVRGVAIGGGQPVAVSPTGQLGFKASSQRFKEMIKPMGDASEAILALRPVTFRYKRDMDPTATPQFGLIAEEVAERDTDLVVRDEKGHPFGVRYEEVNAMLLNEFLKAHRRLGEQDEAITALNRALAAEEKIARAAQAQQQREIDSLRAAVKQQAAQIHEVSDLLPPAKPLARRLVSDQ